MSSNPFSFNTENINNNNNNKTPVIFKASIEKWKTICLPPVWRNIYFKIKTQLHTEVSVWVFQHLYLVNTNNHIGRKNRIPWKVIKTSVTNISKVEGNLPVKREQSHHNSSRLLDLKAISPLIFILQYGQKSPFCQGKRMNCFLFNQFPFKLDLRRYHVRTLAWWMKSGTVPHQRWKLWEANLCSSI